MSHRTRKFILLMALIPTLFPIAHTNASVTGTLAGRSQQAPRFIYDKGNGTLDMYTTVDLGAWGGDIARVRNRTQAGSGLTQNDCDKQRPGQVRGWLPNGLYTITEYSDDWPGQLIQGIVWRISDKACRQAGGREPVGTIRNELFIHTNWNGGVHLTSNGCIKVKKPDIQLLKSIFDVAFSNDAPLTNRVIVRD